MARANVGNTTQVSYEGGRLHLGKASSLHRKLKSGTRAGTDPSHSNLKSGHLDC